jgi:hypothetical protein
MRANRFDVYIDPDFKVRDTIVRLTTKDIWQEIYNGVTKPFLPDRDLDPVYVSRLVYSSLRVGNVGRWI